MSGVSIQTNPYALGGFRGSGWQWQPDLRGWRKASVVRCSDEGVKMFEVGQHNVSIPEVNKAGAPQTQISHGVGYVVMCRLSRVEEDPGLNK